MTRSLPPPHLLRALIATARHGSVVRAAEHLHLTAGAVSKQLLELERRFGMTLFERVRKRLQLTEAGQRYVERVAPLLDEIERVTLALLDESTTHGSAEAVQTLHLSMLPTVGAKWLVPRLSDFLAGHPRVELRFVPYREGYDFSHPTLDCAIRYGRGHWPGALADYLVGHEVVLIAPPGTSALLRAPVDVLQHTLLHHMTEPKGWTRWAAAHGLTDTRLATGPQMDQVATQIRAVAAGMGLALVARCLVEDELADGSVESPPWADFRQKTGYFLCYPQARRELPALQAFRHWLLAQTGGALPA